MFDGNFAGPPANKPKISVAAPISFRKVQPSKGQLIIGCMPKVSGLLEMKKFKRGLSHGFLVYLTAVLEILLRWLRVNHVV